MEISVDHYAVLGLPSGEEGAKLTEKDISRRFKQKALELHPDKRPDDPNAHANFQRLKSSYEILKDVKARRLYDNLLRVKRKRYVQAPQKDSKRQKMMSDLEERERNGSASDPVAKAQEEDRIVFELQQQISRIKAMIAEERKRKDESNKDREKMLRVSWKKGSKDFRAESLKALFSKFGEVVHVVIHEKKCLALVQMATKEEAVTAVEKVCEHLSNSLSVLLVQQAAATVSSRVRSPEESNQLKNLVHAGYQAFEDSVSSKVVKKKMLFQIRQKSIDRVHPELRGKENTNTQLLNRSNMFFKQFT